MNTKMIPCFKRGGQYHEGSTYTGSYVVGGAKLHPRSYKPPKERKNDGTMLLRAPGEHTSKRVRGPEWMQPDGKRTRTIPNIHPQGYQLQKGRKDDGTMLVRVNGANSEPVRVPIPDNFQIVHFPRLDRQPLSEKGPEYCTVMDEALDENHARENAGKPCIGTCGIEPVGCSVCTRVAA